MSSYARAVSAELLKLKRTLALWLAVGAPLAVVLLNVVVYSRTRELDAPGGSALIGFAQLSFTMWTIIVLPLYAALAAALVAATDHQGDHWAQLLALPVPRASIFAAKYVATACLLALSELAFVTAVVGASILLAALRPALHGQPVPAALVAVRGLESGLAACLVVAIQTLVSLRFRSMVVGLGLGIVAVLGLLGGVARVGLGTIAIYVYPWALAPTTMGRLWEAHADRVPVAIGGALAGLLMAVAGSWWLARRDSY
ncbi:MAG: ABC transporter permease [Gemmatimonadaceae bacterium]